MSKGKGGQQQAGMFQGPPVGGGEAHGGPRSQGGGPSASELKKTRGPRSVSRVAILATPVATVATMAVLIADLLGTAGFVGENVSLQGLDYVMVVGFPLSWYTGFMVILLFALTTGLQLVAAGQSYLSGTNPYYAGIGAWLEIAEGVMRRAGADYQPRSGMTFFITHFRRVGQSSHGNWEGLQLFQLLIIPSLIFDVATDYQFYAQTPLAHPLFLVVLAASSIFSEQLAYLASVSRAMEDEGRQALGERPRF